jgi:hypothetical protein
MNPRHHVEVLVQVRASCATHGSADECIKSALYLRYTTLEIKRANLNAKFLDEKLAKVGLDLVMTRTARKVAK